MPPSRSSRPTICCGRSAGRARSRAATFDGTETRGLEPDYKAARPDLPGRPRPVRRRKPRFVAGAVRLHQGRKRLDRAAGGAGQKLMQQYIVRAGCESKSVFGVPASVVPGDMGRGRGGPTADRLAAMALPYDACV